MKHLPLARLTDIQELPPLILVECMSSDKSRYFVERDTERCDWKSTVEDIARGEIENVQAVYELGRNVPVTEDMARAVMDWATEEHGSIPEHLIDFLEDQLGCRVVAQVQRECAGV